MSGCSLIPDVAHEPRIHNPFPQLHRVAVLPFFNQSAEPTVDGELVAKHYYTELQQIPGFEVIPVGVVKQYMLATQSDPRAGVDFQAIARDLKVDAVVAGSITEFTPYYPPRMGLAVRWYAANPSFHEIPPGYGLPWGTTQEEYIPDDLVFEAEFALAKEQLKTQTPEVPSESGPVRSAQHEELPAPRSRPQPGTTRSNEIVPSKPDSIDGSATAPRELPQKPEVNKHTLEASGAASLSTGSTNTSTPNLPDNWPDPRGFVPRPPSRQRPPLRPQPGPIMSHIRLYDGHDSDFTSGLAEYYYFRDDARFGGWQAYLQRSEDFIRFCCYMHISEMLSARGGVSKTRVVWRWPISRYER